MTAADQLLDILEAWGVDVVFGLPPMPPRVSVEQAAHFGEALVKGTPRRGRLALTVLSDTVRGVT
jgi:hypothetical protein